MTISNVEPSLLTNRTPEGGSPVLRKPLHRAGTFRRLAGLVLAVIDQKRTLEIAKLSVGLAVIDSDGKFAGIARLKPAVVAGPAGVPLPSQALLVPADSVREFLKAKGVAVASGASDAKASVLRLVCVRK